MDWVSLLLLIVVVIATSLFYYLYHKREKKRKMDSLERWKEWRRRTIRREQGQKAHREVEEEAGERQG